MRKENNNQLTSSRKVVIRDINALLQTAPISRIKTLRDDEGRYRNVGQVLPDNKGRSLRPLREKVGAARMRGIFKEEALNKNDFRAPLRSGFTLIELLVVVLIIGILAAVALPQYQIAVGKARMIEGISLCNSLAKAQQIYFLANGDYSHSLADIDIEMPAGGTMNTQKNRIEYPHFTLTMEGEKNNDWYCGIVSKSANIMYYHYWRPSAFFFQTDCRAPTEDKISTSICKNIGGKLKGSWNGSDGKLWRSYVILENK